MLGVDAGGHILGGVILVVHAVGPQGQGELQEQVHVLGGVAAVDKVQQAVADQEGVGLVSTAAVGEEQGVILHIVVAVGNDGGEAGSQTHAGDEILHLDLGVHLTAAGPGLLDLGFGHAHELALSGVLGVEAAQHILSQQVFIVDDGGDDGLLVSADGEQAAVLEGDHQVEADGALEFGHIHHTAVQHDRGFPAADDGGAGVGVKLIVGIGDLGNHLGDAGVGRIGRCVGGLGILGGVGRVGGVRLSAAGRQRQHHQRRKQQRKKLFHGVSSNSGYRYLHCILFLRECQ